MHEDIARKMSYISQWNETGNTKQTVKSIHTVNIKSDRLIYGNFVDKFGNATAI